ncbi:MAG TPA: CHASE domain-containing protein [Pseudoduganella sp.]
MGKSIRPWGDWLATGKLPVVAAMVLCAGTAITGLLATYLYYDEQGQRRRDLAYDAARMVAQTERRLDAHFESLQSLKALFATSDHVDRRQFHRFLEQLDLRRSHPGFQAIQFVRYVPDPELARYEAAMRQGLGGQAPAVADFHIKPRVQHPDHYVIEYTEPLAGNQAALGYDIASKPPQRAAIERGRDTGRPVASPRIPLVQDPHGPPAFVASWPIYRSGLPLHTVAQRRAAFYGFTSVVYRVNDLMQEILDRQLLTQMRVKVFDTGDADDHTVPRRYSLLFDSKQADGIALPGDELAALSASHALAVGQRRWEMQFVALEGTRYDPSQRTAAMVALAGAVISALIASLLMALARHQLLARRLSAALDRLQAITDNATVGIELIRQRRIRRCNQGIAETLGYSRRELAGAATRIKYDSDAADADMADVAEAALRIRRSWIGEVEWVRKDGRRIWCRLHGKSVVPGEPEQGAIWVSYDITAQKQSDAALRQANQELARSLQQLERAQRHFTHLIEFSRCMQACPTLEEAFRCVCGYAPQLFPLSAGAVYLLEDDRQNLSRQTHWGTPAAAPLRLPVGLAQSTPGQQIPVSICLPLLAQATPFGLLYLEQQPADDAHGGDAAQRLRLAHAWAENIALCLANLRLRDTLRLQSQRDPLTGLFNRRQMDTALSRELAHAAQCGTLVAVAIVDVDHFKRINDKYGHDAGDTVLQAVAHIVAQQAHSGGIACRFGGEEFVLILPGSTEQTALERTEHLLRTLAARNCQHGTVTASCGLALYPLHGSDAAGVLQAADCALYRAKQNGRNRVVLASPAGHTAA